MPEEEADRLMQKHFLATILEKHKPSDMITVYDSYHGTTCHRGIFATLFSPSAKHKVLKDIYWNVHSRDLLPIVEEYTDNDGSKYQEYYRYGYNEEFEPLIICRNFYDMRESYIEICEEFRCYHNLYHDSKSGKYIKICDSGIEEEVIIVKDNKVQMRLKEIKEFLSIKEMFLVIFFDNVEHSKNTFEHLGLSDNDNEDIQENYIWKLGVRGEALSGDTESFSRLCGKLVVKGFNKDADGGYFFLSETEKQYMDFMIDEEDNGTPVVNTSNPAELNDFFEKNPSSPNYLTSVKFKKAVLEKYYLEPNKYSVEAGYLRCGDLWGMQIDNHHKDYICAWLGDLGRDLPYIEQQHWRQYNIVGGEMISQVYYDQQLMCKPTAPDQPDLIFKDLYCRLSNISETKLGWNILLPLSEKDLHYLAMIRCLDTKEQKVFDDIIMALAKILIDSINEKQLKKYMIAESRKDMKGISKLEIVLKNFFNKNAEEHIKFLRQLQDLRSKSAAHRKGAGYLKLINEMGIENKSIIDIIVTMLTSANKLLRFLISAIVSGEFPNHDAT